MRPCPFCRVQDHITGLQLSVTSNGFEQFTVFCDKCGAEGPIGVDEKEAIRLWNQTNNLIDYHEVIKILEGLQPVKMGGTVAITEGSLLDKLHQQIRSLKRG